jgi:hypothetical protein
MTEKKDVITVQLLTVQPLGAGNAYSVTMQNILTGEYFTAKTTKDTYTLHVCQLRSLSNNLPSVGKYYLASINRLKIPTFCLHHEVYRKHLPAWCDHHIDLLQKQIAHLARLKDSHALPEDAPF